MTPTMREKLARAVDQAMTGAGNVFDPAPQAYRDKCFAIVDAILAVLREPTREMIDAAYAAHDAFEEAEPPAAWCGLADAYRAMIDTITNEGRG